MIRSLMTLAVIVVATSAAAQEHQHGAATAEQLGTVSFTTSCKPAVQQPFNRAVALLHSFDFGKAIDGFNQVLTADPTCAIAYWGIALSRWGNPFAAGLKPAAQLQQGRDAIGRAASIQTTARERAYIDAAARLFADFEQRSQADRVRAYRDAMADVAARYPDDIEAAIFYALPLAFAADPSDKAYVDQLKAGAILDKLFAAQPNHPGLAHYIIHTYDVPALANRALEAALRYAKIAPSSAHAFHMPSHAFTRVGYWQESIETNIASATVARRDKATGEELHATDYRVYAYLQTGQDRSAQRLLTELPEIGSRFDPTDTRSAAPPAAGFFALAAVPARYALERGAWKEAASLELRPSPFPFADAITHFARALGAARLGDTASVRSSIDALTALRDRLTAANERYWAEQVEIQRRGATAWLAMAEHRDADALAEMRAAAERENATEKNAMTPGPLAPAGELLGEMLLELKRPADALKEFEATLGKEPNRFRAVAGAARAASLIGNRTLARKYYQQLLKICAKGDKPGRPDLESARRYR
jgi:hypothetical protein